MRFLDADSVRDSDGVGITLSYWRLLKAIENWTYDALHMQCKELGRKYGIRNTLFAYARLKLKIHFPFKYF